MPRGSPVQGQNPRMAACTFLCLVLLVASSFTSTAFVVRPSPPLPPRPEASWTRPLAPSLRAYPSPPPLHPLQPTALAAHQSSFLATCVPGLGPVLARELEGFGCTDVRVSSGSGSGVTFAADLRTALRALMWSRTCHKLLELLCRSDGYDGPQCDVRDRDSLMQFVRDSVDVKELLGDGRGGLLTLSVQVVYTSGGPPPDLTHSKYTALSIKNALCDEVRELRGDRPDVDAADPDVPLVAFVRGAGGGSSSVSLYRQWHAGSLHRRGYRLPGVPVHKAAVKESLAAGLLLSAGFHERLDALRNVQSSSEGDERSVKQSQKKLVVVDPMTGSGTLLVEALLLAADVAPGWCRLAGGIPGHRLPSVTRWKHSDSDVDVPRLWNELLQEAKDRAANGLRWLKDAHGRGELRFAANDCHAGALDLLDSALRAASDTMAPGLDSLIDVHHGDCRAWNPAKCRLPPADSEGADNPVPTDDKQCLVVCNPPWGERLSEDVHESWESLRTFLRKQCPPDCTEAWVLSGNPEATKHLGLRRSASLSLQTGRQQLRWLRYELRSKPPERKERNVSEEDGAPTQSPSPRKVRQFDDASSRRATAPWRSFGENDFNDSFRRTSWSPGARNSRKTDRSPNSRPRPKEVAAPKPTTRPPQERQNEWLL